METRLAEDDDTNRHHTTKTLSAFKSSPETFTKEFLQSYKSKNHSRELISDLYDDDEQIDKDEYHSDALSTSTVSTNQNESSLADEVNQEKLSSASTLTPTRK